MWYYCSIHSYYINQIYMESTISTNLDEALTEFAISRILGNNRVMAKLMLAFNKGQNTIELWIKEHRNLKDPGKRKTMKRNPKNFLATNATIEVLNEEYGLLKEAIVEVLPTEGVAN